eukprot:1139124-Pelagomonas_calceolata.AAC.1
MQVCTPPYMQSWQPSLQNTTRSSLCACFLDHLKPVSRPFARGEVPRSLCTTMQASTDRPLHCRQCGIRVLTNLFHSSLSILSIIFQQLSMKAASTIYSRFLFLCGVLPPSSAHTQALITPRKRKADERLEAASEPAVASSSSSSSSSSRKQQATEGRKTRRSGQRNKGPVDEDPVALLTTPKQQQPAVTAAAEHASTEGGGTGTDGQVIRPLEPSDVLGCSLEALRGCGLSGQKASYLTGIASAFAAADAAASRGEKVRGI